MHRKPLPDWDDDSLDDARSTERPAPLRGIVPLSKRSVPLDKRGDHPFKSELARDRMSPIHFRKTNASFGPSPSAPMHTTQSTSPTIVPTSSHPPPDIYPQSQVLHVRERLLHIIDAVTSLVTAASTIDNTVTTTAKLDEKVSCVCVIPILLPPL